VARPLLHRPRNHTPQPVDLGAPLDFDHLDRAILAAIEAGTS